MSGQAAIDAVGLIPARCAPCAEHLVVEIAAEADEPVRAPARARRTVLGDRGPGR